MKLLKWLNSKLTPDKQRDLICYNDPQVYHDILNNVQVFPNASATNLIKAPKLLFIYSESYHSFLNNCIKFLLSEDGSSNTNDSSKLNTKNHNVLTFGFSVVKHYGDYLGTLENIGERSSIQYLSLKSLAWKILYSRIGAELLSELFFNYNGCLDATYVPNSANPGSRNSVHQSIQLFGNTTKIDRKGLKYYNTTKNNNDFTVALRKSKMFYRNIKSPLFKIKRLLPQDPAELVSYVFKLSTNGDNYSKKRNLKTKYAKIYKLFQQMIHKHNKKCYYGSILDKVCPQFSDFSAIANITDLSVSEKQVIKFIAHVLSTLFPDEVFGSGHNRQIVYSCIATFIFMPQRASISISDAIKGIKIKDVPWLNKAKDTHQSKRENINKQDFEARQKLLKLFISWLFNYLINGLVSCFFHVTHMTNIPHKHYYFHHRTWQQLQKQFLSKYFSEYLKKRGDSVRIGYGTDVIIGNIRVFPKKGSDFRVICFPDKGKTAAARISYFFELKRQIQPVKSALKELRIHLLEKHCDKAKIKGGHNNDEGVIVCITSRNDIVYNLQEFKMKVKPRNGMIYFKKFDIKACYDLLPIYKILDIVNSNIADDAIFLYDFATKKGKFVAYGASDSQKLISGIYSNTINTNDAGESSTSNHNRMNFSKPRIDKATHQLFSKLQILSVVKAQLFNTAVQVKGHEHINDIAAAAIHDNSKLYCRKRGVFQGFHLSAAFCDLIFDQLMSELDFTKLGGDDTATNDTHTKVIRYADDFLILSTSKHIVIKIYDLLATKFAQHEIFINEDKTASNVTHSNHFFSDKEPCQHEIGLNCSPKSVKIDQLTKVKTLSFCGLIVNWASWSIIKDQPFLKPLHFTSLKKLLVHAMWQYESRLSSLLLSLERNSTSAVRSNIIVSVENTIQFVIQSLTKMAKGSVGINAEYRNGGSMLSVAMEIVKWALGDICNKTNIRLRKMNREEVYRAKVNHLSRT